MSAADGDEVLEKFRETLEARAESARHAYSVGFREGPLGTFDLGELVGRSSGANIALESFDAAFPYCSLCGRVFRSKRTGAAHRANACRPRRPRARTS